MLVKKKEGRVAEGHPDGRLKIALFKSKSAFFHNFAVLFKSTSGVLDSYQGLLFKSKSALFHNLALPFKSTSGVPGSYLGLLNKGLLKWESRMKMLLK